MLERLIENYLPPVQEDGFNTLRPVRLKGVVEISGATTVASGTATTAGGAVAFSLGTNGPDITWGSGVPTITAPQGSLYLRTDGSSTSTRAYINTDGMDTWTAITTAA
mgnify:CR=1 FL=1